MRFRADGTFKILQLTDIHYVEGNESDKKTDLLIKRIIDKEKPDIIVITGDTVYGEKNLEMVPKAFGAVSESGIPWTFVFGNHDDEDGHSKEELFDAISKLPGCLSYDDKKAGAGTGNHTINVTGFGGEIVWRLMLLDSGTYLNQTTKEDYDYIKETQIEWYKDKVEELHGKGGAIAFFHIPLPEYNEAFEGNHIGERNEDVCASPVNSGLAEVMAGDGVTRAVFAGHDHINNYIGKYKSVILGYGRATGYNTYSCEGYRHGARIILISENDCKNIKTWERLEDGSVLSYDCSNL